ncbi:MAG: hypothetical protein WC979_01290 [Candidatus Pacearchaeota archaeon]
MSCNSEDSLNASTQFKDIDSITYVEQGKNYGRTAAIMYLNETHQLKYDSTGKISIELSRLLTIEDSLQKAKK